MAEKILNIPLKKEEIRALRVGDVVYLNGPIFTSRDMGHFMIKKYLEENRPLPVEFEGSAIFHAGPVVKKKKMEAMILLSLALLRALEWSLTIRWWQILE